MDSQQIELVGRAWLEARMTRAGFEIAKPARDKGIDLIAFSDRPGMVFRAVPIQMKAASERVFSVERKYVGRGIVMAYVWGGLEVTPRVFLVPHDEAVGLLPEQTRQTESWAKRGFWVTTRPSVELTAALTRYEDNFATLGLVHEGASRDNGPLT
jgi:hypothetical protein